MSRRIAIMQPYIFPYIGYFQLITAVDLFVFYNDVNFIMRGWVNRNRILLNGRDHLFTVPCKDASQNKLICETETAFPEKDRRKLLSTFKQAYAKAPYFPEVFGLLTTTLMENADTIDRLSTRSIKDVCSYLGYDPVFVDSKGRYGNIEMRKEERLIDICKQEQCDDYVNTIGGTALYSKTQFAEKGISLSFLRTEEIIYEQFSDIFVPNLSIIDVLMFNSKDTVRDFLKRYQLV